MYLLLIAVCIMCVVVGFAIGYYVRGRIDSAMFAVGEHLSRLVDPPSRGNIDNICDGRLYD